MVTKGKRPSETKRVVAANTRLADTLRIEQAANEQLRVKIQDMGFKVEDLNHSVAYLRAANDSMAKDNTELLVKAKDLGRAFKQVQEERLKNYNWYNQRVTELRGTKLSLMNEIDDLKAQLQSADIIIKNLRSDLGKAHESTKAYERESAKLREALETHKWANEALLRKLWVETEPKKTAWNGDSGDLVDLERKLDALLGKDATKILRDAVHQRRR